MFSLLFVRVINQIIVIVKIINICIVTVRIYNFAKNKSVFQKNMASAAGGSSGGGGDRCPSWEKGTTLVGRRSKKPSTFHGAALRYLEKEHRECVARGEEPPFALEDLLWCYGSSPPNSEVPAPPSSSAPVRNPSEHSAFPRKDGWKPMCCRDFGRRLRRHWLIGPLSRMYHHVF